MLHSKRFFGLLVLAGSCSFAMQTAACGDDDATTPTVDSGKPDSNTTAADTGPGTDAADAAKPAPVFLDSSDFADLFTVDPSFPYGVTARHAADGTIAGSTKWGTTGPVVTAMPNVTTWTLPSDPKGAAQSAMTTAAMASGLPDAASYFYGADGFVELPFPFALQSYSTGAPPFTGEALLYAPAFGSVLSRAYVNGFYSGVGITDGTTDEVVYAGLSGLAATAPAADLTGNGLWAAPLCAGMLVATGTCAPSYQLFAWTGNSGPVTSDANGNVLVAASLAFPNGAIYGVTKAQGARRHDGDARNHRHVRPARRDVLGDGDCRAGHNDRLDAHGGLRRHDDGRGPRHQRRRLHELGGWHREGTHDFASVITPTAAVTGFALFNDPEGNLWAAVTTATAGAFVELQQKP